jgi:metal-responsive CopG/Arc/MetJ family transcriptional regulator
MEKERKKVGISLDPEVLIAIDEYAKKNGINRSGAISVLCMQMLSGIKASNSLDLLIDRMKNTDNAN